MRVLILGSGQLARMMYLAGSPLGIQVQAVDVGTDSVVDPITKEALDLTLEDAIEEADAIKFMVDVENGITGMDEEVANLLRKV